MFKYDLALLFLRLGFGSLMLFGHGLPKILEFTQRVETFSDPLGFGRATSLVLAIFAEVFCSAAVILGVMTRWAAIPLAFTMAVAAVVVHAQDPWAKKELPIVFLIAFVCLIVAGGGRFALDSLRKREE